MAGKSLTITYLGDASSVLNAQKQIDAGHSKLDDTVTASGNKFKSTFSGIMPLAAAAAGTAVVKFATDSIKAFNESEAANAQTEARLKSTGGTANVTADDVGNLANTIRNLSGIDDEAVQSSENMLLTFTKVRNEVGKGNDIFNQATAAIADMATGMNQGAIPSSDQLQAATIQLGKALNDPIAGMGALSRVGVQFTDQQKEQITTLVASGRQLEAQKIILGEVETQFGGAAKAAGDTFAGSMAKAANAVEDIQEVLGKAIVTAVQPLLEAFTELVDKLGPAVSLIFESVGEAAAGAAGQVLDLVDPLLQLIDLLPDLSGSAKESSGWMHTMGETGAAAFKNIAGWFNPVIKGYFDTKDAVKQTADEEQVHLDVVNTLVDYYEGKLIPALTQSTDHTSALEKTTRALTDAQRENRLAVLAAEDSFLGLRAAGQQLADAQREVNRLHEKGKDDTKAYRDAVADTVTEQLAFEQALIDYAKQADDAGKSTKEIANQVRAAGREAGLTKEDVNNLVDEIRTLIRESENYDGSHYTATYTAIGEGIGNLPPGVGPRWHAEGGIFTKPTVIGIGEAGPEAVIPLDKGGGMGGNVTVNVAGSVITEQDLAQVVRDELIRFTRRNPSVGF